MRSCAVILAFAALLPGQAPSANSDEVVITIGDRKITAAQYELLVRTLLPAQQQEVALGPGRRQVAQRIVELSVLAAEAEKRNLDRQPDVAMQLDYQHDNLLAVAMFQALSKSATVPDADVQAWYDAHKSDYEVLTARHILVRVKGAPFPGVPGKPEISDDEARAKADSIRKRIVEDGEDFAKIAKAESDDLSSAEKGGDLGEFGRGKQVPPFEQAAYALKPGEISEPVLTPFGYHIIQVQTHSVKSLADVKQDILNQLKPDLARKAVDALMNKTKYDISEAFFGPAPVAVSTAGH